MYPSSRAIPLQVYYHYSSLGVMGQRVKNWRGGEVVGYMYIDMVGASVVMVPVC